MGFWWSSRDHWETRPFEPAVGSTVKAAEAGATGQQEAQGGGASHGRPQRAALHQR